MITTEQIIQATTLEELVLQNHNKYLDAKYNYGENSFITKCYKAN